MSDERLTAPTPGDVAAFLAFLEERRLYHEHRIKDFPADDKQMKAIFEAARAALAAMQAMVEGGMHPYFILTSMNSESANMAGRWAVMANDRVLPLMMATQSVNELGHGMSVQGNLEEASGRKN